MWRKLPTLRFFPLQFIYIFTQFLHDNELQRKNRVNTKTQCKISIDLVENLKHSATFSNSISVSSFVLGWREDRLNCTFFFYYLTYIAFFSLVIYISLHINLMTKKYPACFLINFRFARFRRGSKYTLPLDAHQNSSCASVIYFCKGSNISSYFVN